VAVKRLPSGDGSADEQAWLAHLPSYIADELRGSSLDRALGRTRRFDAAVLFVDVAGFTGMSESLGRTGRQGTEELTEVLNAWFGRMMEVIEAHRGVVAKFAGDAMTIVFPCAGARRSTAARQALQCALEMQDGMRGFSAVETSAGRHALAMTAGAAFGVVLTTTVGDPAIRLEHVTAGDVLARSAEAEHLAERGELVAHEDIVMAAGGVQIARRRGRFSWIEGLVPPGRPRRPAGPRTAEVGSVAGLRAFLHPAIAERLATGQAALVNEHRWVVALFAGFAGFDYGDRDAGRRLQEYLRAAIAVVEQHGGHLRQVDVGDKGSKLIAVFGAPVAHEDDAARALRCAHALRTLGGVRARIGVNAGMAFCGEVGSRARREYAVIGDAVNVAARLMELASPAQVLVGANLAGGQDHGLALESHRVMTLRGRSEPLVVHTLEPRSDRPPGAPRPAPVLRMVGRRRELRRIEALLGRAERGRGAVLAVTGPAGIGKSRLAAEALALAGRRAMSIATGAAQADRMGGYQAWRGVLRSLLGVDGRRSPAEAARAAEQALARVDPSGQRIPTLAPVLDLPLAPNRFSASLDSEAAAQTARSLVIDVLRAHAQRAPLLLVLEDCHWLDELSRDLLVDVARVAEGMPLLILVLSRSAEASEHAAEGRAPPTLSFEQIELAPLPTRETARLVRERGESLGLLSGPPPASFLALVDGRAEGNPFFVSEILALLKDRHVDPNDAEALAALDLPDSLQRLLLARIDRLPEREKTVLKVASVVGRRFATIWLADEFPELGDGAELEQRLQGLVAGGLIVPDVEGSAEPGYVFSHAVTRDVAYESMSFAARAGLHERIGAWVERRHADSLDEVVEALAQHYGHSRNRPKQLRYYRLAGDRARATFANGEAIGHYDKLLSLEPDAAVTDVRRALGEVRQLIGDWDEAETVLRDALERASLEGDSHELAECQRALGHLLSYTGAHDEAVALLLEAQDAFEQAGDQSGEARVLEHLGYAYLVRGQHAEALRCAERQAELAEGLSDRVRLSAAADHLGILCRRQGDLEAARRHLERARDIAAGSGDRRGVVHAANDLAAVHALEGDEMTALALLHEAFEQAVDIGYRHAAAMIVVNAGELCRWHGEARRAIRYYAEGLALGADLVDWAILEHAGGLAGALAESGRLPEARRWLVPALILGRAWSSPEVLCEHLMRAADVEARLGRGAQAIDLYREATDLARRQDLQEVAVEAELLATRLLVAAGKLSQDTAVAVAERLAEANEGRERALALDELFRLEPSRVEAYRAAAELYRSLHERTPHAELRRRYVELTGETLEPPPPLPPLPAGLVRPPRLGALRQRVARLIESRWPASK
jgi:class 3 adenylate cyclase/tetratricopeptide (TPR) repeat protein